jgi:hypothetical protein
VTILFAILLLSLELRKELAFLVLKAIFLAFLLLNMLLRCTNNVIYLWTTLLSKDTFAELAMIARGYIRCRSLLVLFQTLFLFILILKYDCPLFNWLAILVSWTAIPSSFLCLSYTAFYLHSNRPSEGIHWWLIVRVVIEWILYC